MINKDKAGLPVGHVLTDEQISKAWQETYMRTGFTDPIPFARAIEAAVLASADNPSTVGADEPVAWALQLKNGSLEFNSGYGMFQTMDIAERAHRQHLGSIAVVPLYLAAPVAQSTAGAATIDTPEFRELLTAQQATEEACSSNGSDANRDAANDAWDALIAHIDSRLAAPAAQAPAGLDLAKLRALVDAARVCTSVTSMREIVECIGALGEKGGEP